MLLDCAKNLTSSSTSEEATSQQRIKENRHGKLSAKEKNHGSDD
jgi:hypothetical protein